MEQSLRNELVFQIMLRLLEEDFTSFRDIHSPKSEEEKILYNLVKKYHDLFSNLYNYFEAEDQKINILSLTCF